MEKYPRYLTVETEALPPIFLKVIEAKELLAQGKVKSSSDAAKQVGISRSAFYKYKDRVFRPVKDQNEMETLSFRLNDEPGVLSRLINTVTQSGANILTINQNIPIDAVAPVTISFRTASEGFMMEELLTSCRQLHGVVEVKRLLGE